eukprot:535596-Pleurochrysis_carterae.AAC.2
MHLSDIVLRHIDHIRSLRPHRSTNSCCPACSHPVARAMANLSPLTALSPVDGRRADGGRAKEQVCSEDRATARIFLRIRAH